MTYRNKLHLPLIIFIVFFSNTVLGQNMMYVDKSRDGSVLYFDDKNIERTTNSMKVWSTIIPSREFRKQRIKELEKIAIPTTGYEKFAKTTSLLEINCSETKYRSLQFIDYEKAGKILYRYNKPTDWSNFMTGTIMNTLYFKVCNEMEMWKQEQLNKKYMQSISKDKCMSKTISSLKICDSQRCLKNMGGVSGDCLVFASGEKDNFCQNYEARYTNTYCPSKDLGDSICRLLYTLENVYCGKK